MKFRVLVLDYRFFSKIIDIREETENGTCPVRNKNAKLSALTV